MSESDAAGPITTPIAVLAATEARAERVRSDDVEQQRRRLLAWGVACTTAGLILLVVAVAILRSANVSARIGIGLLGGAFLWIGLQRIGLVRFGKNFRLGVWFAIGWVTLVVALAVLAPALPLERYGTVVSGHTAAERPTLSLDEPLGTDDLGRSLLTRTIYGARSSLIVGVFGTAVGLVLGGTLGLLAGYYGRRTDGVINLFSNAILAFPSIVLLLALVSVFSRTALNLSLGLALLTIPSFMRLTRVHTMVFAQRDSVLAARALGAKNRRVIVREILPNVVQPILSYAFVVMALLIVAEGSLSFVGLGIAPPNPSWGGMIAAGQARLQRDPHLVFVPAVAMFLTVLALNRLGDWARTSVDTAVVS